MERSSCVPLKTFLVFHKKDFLFHKKISFASRKRLVVFHEKYVFLCIERLVLLHETDLLYFIFRICGVRWKGSLVIRHHRKLLIWGQISREISRFSDMNHQTGEIGRNFISFCHFISDKMKNFDLTGKEKLDPYFMAQSFSEAIALFILQ